MNYEKMTKQEVKNKPSMPFSSGTEYEIFLYNFCYQCQNYKENEDGFPEYPENGGCPILDATERARFDISLFPSKELRQVEYDDETIRWHVCKEFKRLESEENK